MSAHDILARTGPRRLLSIDGGGIRGAFAIEILAEMESTIRATHGAGSEFVLADYFDFVGGTSTGAIIACLVSLGLPVARIRDYYHEHGARIFTPVSWWRPMQKLRHRYRALQLEAMVRDQIGADTTLGSDRLRTLLLIVMRNASTGSPWPVSSNPNARYAQPGSGNNLALPLWQLLLASTAAPTYFPARSLSIQDAVTGKLQRYTFVDGGITVFNNPAYQLFTMATLPQYGLRWSTGEDSLLLISVGTGEIASTFEDLLPDQMHLLFNAQHVPEALMIAAQRQQDLLCRMHGRCLAGEPIDGEVGDLIGERSAWPAHFTYCRYNLRLSPASLAAVGLSHIPVSHLSPMDSVAHIDELAEAGRAVGKARVKAEHFRAFPPPPSLDGKRADA